MTPAQFNAFTASGEFDQMVAAANRRRSLGFLKWGFRRAAKYGPDFFQLAIRGAPSGFYFRPTQQIADELSSMPFFGGGVPTAMDVCALLWRLHPAFRWRVRFWDLRARYHRWRIVGSVRSMSPRILRKTVAALNGVIAAELKGAS